MRAIRGQGGLIDRIALPAPDTMVDVGLEAGAGGGDGFEQSISMEPANLLSESAIGNMSGVPAHHPPA
ncbi:MULTISPECIES: hypothetical protein [Nocardia]|uniref:hypothetical protein n=1 Tax=Nocardia TaxID=1817 RepID=UPI0024546C8A|nr:MULTISPECIES: hypothetical protein [Nocardia]